MLIVWVDFPIAVWLVGQVAGAVWRSSSVDSELAVQFIMLVTFFIYCK